MPPRQLLAGRYRLESQIAAGGVGEVWRGEDTVLTRPVAIKLLRPEFAGHAETLTRFRAEARHAGAMSHPAIARVYDYGDPVPPYPAFLVMELVDGPSLAAVLAAGPFGAAQTMDVVAQVASGLQTAHEAALVHRDIKPANLLLAANGQVKITDFGIAHVAGSVPVTSTGTVMGTPAYLAPERVSGRSATPASDLYSLGVVAYECLAGAPPFTGKPLDVAVAHRDRPLPPFPYPVPAEVARLVAELTAKNPAARPVSAEEVAIRAALLREDAEGGADGEPSAWQYGIPVTATGIAAASGPVTPPEPTVGWRPPRPRRAGRIRWTVAAASVAAAAAAVTVLALVMAPGPGPTSHQASAAGPGQVSQRQTQAAQPSPPATPSPSPTASSPSAPSTVDVTADALIGEPLDQVRQELQLLGLTVRVQRDPSDQETGTVVAVQPSGRVRPASTILVTVATMFPQDNGPGPGHHHHHNGGGGGGGSAGQVSRAAGTVTVINAHSGSG
jgi:eukaryotic-like serine/threonine-protein kinase